MVKIKSGKNELELKFGLGELNAIDKELGYEVRDINQVKDLKLYYLNYKLVMF